MKKRSFSTMDSDTESEDGYCEGGEIKKNHIYLNGDISGDTATELINEIDRVSYDIIKLKFSYDVKDLPIYLHINSNGGCVHSAFRIVDKILKNPVPIITIVDGFCGSSATFISIVGSQRLATQHSYFLIHQLSAGHMGKIRDLKDSIGNCKRIQKRIEDLYLKHTKIGNKRLGELLKREKEFDVDIALEMGFVDSIY